MSKKITLCGFYIAILIYLTIYAEIIPHSPTSMLIHIVVVVTLCLRAYMVEVNQD